MGTSAPVQHFRYTIPALSSLKMSLFFYLIFVLRWNQLDSLIVLLSIAGIGMETMKSGQILPINPTLIRVLRVLRIARGK
jgi:hypothetical protein